MAMDPPDEKRQAQRYPIAAAVRWEGGEGVTENISGSGVYFVTPQRLELDESVRLTLILPRESIPLTAHGTVVRIERKGEGAGVAAHLDEIWPLPTV